jgi:uncharacterized protein (DUF1684 family)
MRAVSSYRCVMERRDAKATEAVGICLIRRRAPTSAEFDHLVVDLNFLYHPSCRYDSRWLCPLAPPGNTINAAVAAGERM